jgi:hypothetical protein
MIVFDVIFFKWEEVITIVEEVTKIVLVMRKILWLLLLIFLQILRLSKRWVPLILML